MISSCCIWERIQNKNGFSKLYSLESKVIRTPLSFSDSPCSPRATASEKRLNTHPEYLLGDGEASVLKGLDLQLLGFQPGLLLHPLFFQDLFNRHLLEGCITLLF